MPETICYVLFSLVFAYVGCLQGKIFLWILKECLDFMSTMCYLNFSVQNVILKKGGGYFATGFRL